MSHRAEFRIGYWLGHLSLQYGGIGPYTVRTITALLEEKEPAWEFGLLCHAEAQEAVKQILAASGKKAEVHVIPSFADRVNFWRQLRGAIGTGGASTQDNSFNYARQNQLEVWVERLNLDLVHFPTPTTPHPHEHVPYLVPPLLKLRTPYIVTIHDAQELHFPEYFSAAQRAIRAMHRWETIDQARKIIVSYEHVKEDLLKYYRLPPEKIHVCPIPFRSISWQEPTLAAILTYEEKYRPWEPFLLYPAQTWPHKNHALLFQALRKLRREYKLATRLICPGYPNDYRDEIKAQVEKLELTDAVLFTGVVPEDELAWLYRHTALVVVPTMYEAGSFPVMEAISQGAPVICSDVTSLPETIRDRRFVFSPYDAEALSELIARMLTSASFHQENVANSVRQAKRLGRVNAAAHFYETYRSLLETA
ncbi:MAG: glycosyltransferase family 4 protein [Pyrinomonadaceae bacterium]